MDLKYVMPARQPDAFVVSWKALQRDGKHQSEAGVPLPRARCGTAAVGLGDGAA